MKTLDQLTDEFNEWLKGVTDVEHGSADEMLATIERDLGHYQNRMTHKATQANYLRGFVGEWKLAEQAEDLKRSIDRWQSEQKLKPLLHAKLEAIGYQEYHTGGGCMAYQKAIDCGLHGQYYVLVTDGDAGIDFRLDDPVMIGTYDDRTGEDLAYFQCRVSDTIQALIDLESIGDILCTMVARRWGVQS